MAMPLETISFEQARHIVEEHAAGIVPPAREQVDLLECRGRVLADSVLADRPFPPFRRAARDGYAARSSDLRTLPATLRVIGEVKAGADFDLEIAPGETVSIMTGAATPSSADAIVMIEHTSRDGDLVTFSRGAESGANIVATGAEAAMGEALLLPGTLLDYAAISVAASVGKSVVPVFPRPRVSILATGDEIVPVHARPGKNQIRNSNSYSIAAQVAAAGGEPVLLPVAPDDPSRLRELILEGLQADLLLLAGGVSMGKYDLVEQVLGDLGAEFFFTGVAIQPGKPAVFGKCGERYFFGLPGNPVSTMVTFALFAKPMVQALAGMTAKKLVFLRAELKTPISAKPGLKRFLPATLSGEFEHAEVELARWQGSGDIAATARANCYVVVPPDVDVIPVGLWVSVLIF